MARSASRSDDSGGSADEKAYQLPERWKWVHDILDMAHLPHYGLPVKWETTQKTRIKTIYNPEKKRRSILIQVKKRNIRVRLLVLLMLRKVTILCRERRLLLQ